MTDNTYMSTYTKRQSYQYHADTTDFSVHSIERHMQRVSHLSASDQALVSERALAAAAHPKNGEHTGARILTTASEHIWAVVAGRTVKTIIVTPKGQHLDKTSPCNRYVIIN